MKPLTSKFSSVEHLVDEEGTMRPNKNKHSSVQSISLSLDFWSRILKGSLWGLSEPQPCFQFFIHRNSKNSQGRGTLKDRPALLCATEMTSLIMAAVPVIWASEDLSAGIKYRCKSRQVHEHWRCNQTGEHQIRLHYCPRQVSFATANTRGRHSITAESQPSENSQFSWAQICSVPNIPRTLSNAIIMAHNVVQKMDRWKTDSFIFALTLHRRSIWLMTNYYKLQNPLKPFTEQLNLVLTRQTRVLNVARVCQSASQPAPTRAPLISKLH